MAFRNAQQSRIYIGALSAAAYARTVSGASVTDMVDVSTINDTAKAFIPGQDTSTFSIAGPVDVDTTANGMYDLLLNQKSVANVPISYLPLGTDGHVWLIDGIHTQFDTEANVAGSADWTLAAQTDGLTDMAGVVYENNTTVTADTDGTAIDNGAATSNGAVLHLHVTAFSGFTSDAIIVEGSTTGSFAGEETTLASFTSVTGLTSERVEVTGTVKRYLRVADDVTGTGSITRFVAISRR